jgi:hypothetical protein
VETHVARSQIKLCDVTAVDACQNRYCASTRVRWSKAGLTDEVGMLAVNANRKEKGCGRAERAKMK